jgi:exopolyphosphatase/guanosine-5'-triphosphate,3'-diphosphate pyrophosphatase
MKLGIVDVGTNSIHLLIGTLGLNGKFHAILKQRELTRLGQGGLVNGMLSTRAMRRALAVLRRYAATLKRYNVDHVEAVATSAVREARNDRQFVRRVRTRLGLPLRLISGREEARLIYLGVLATRPFRRATVIVSIGGGSAQVIHGNGLHLRYVTSMPLGCARLAQRFIRHDPPRPEEVRELDRYVRRRWAPVVREIRRHRWHRAFGSSATIHQLMAAAHFLAHRKFAGANFLSIRQRSLRRLVRWLSTSTAAQRRRLTGLDPRREDLALATGLALLALMEGCGITTMYFAPGSLREGLALNWRGV